MTFEEAKGTLNYLCQRITNLNTLEGIKFGINALEKQIPKNPTIHGYREGREVNTISYTCPICNKHIGREDFCKHCGQALDWGDSE